MGIDEIFGNVYCPNFTLDNPSLRTLLNQLFLVKDRIPYVKDDVIYAMDITERKGAFSLNKMNSITSSRTSENHCTGLKRSYKDALSGSNTARMVEYIGFRNSDNALLTLGNMRVETKFPIYKINKIYLCYYKKAQVWTYNTNPPSYTGEDKVFLCKQDITKLVLQEEARNLISKDWNDFTNNRPNTIDEMAQYKLCTIGYTIGSNKIEGWGTSYEYPSGWWGVTTATKTYIENIFDILDEIHPYGIYDVGYLSKELGAGKYITINSQIQWRIENIVSPIEATKGALRLKSFFFIVDYEGFYNGTLNTSKDDEKSVSNEEEDLSFDFSNASANEIDCIIDKLGTKSQFDALKARVEQLRKQQIEQRKREEEARKAAEDAARKAEEQKKRYNESMEKNNQYLELLKSYAEALEEDNERTKQRTQAFEETKEMENRFAEDQRVKAEQALAMVDEINSIIGPVAENVSVVKR